MYVYVEGMTEEGKPIEYGVNDARPILGDLVKDAAKGRPSIISYRGETAAVLVPPFMMLAWIEEAERGGLDLNDEQRAFKGRLTRLEADRNQTAWRQAAEAAELPRPEGGAGADR